LAYAARSLAKARTFTFVCVVSLGIGMAPVIAVPYGARIFETSPVGLNTDGLVEIITTQVGPRAAANNWSYPDFVDLRDADTGIAIIGWIGGQSEVTFPGVDEFRASTLYVSSGYFSAVEVALVQGPGFDEAMHDPLNAQPAVILGYNFWQNRLSADPDIIGKALTLDAVPHVVVGVTPELFRGHQFEGRELFLPLETHPRFMTDDSVRFDRSNEWIHFHGRLSPGVGLAQASAAVSTVTSQLAREHPSTNEFKAGAVEPYHPLGAVARSQILIIQAVVLTVPSIVLLVVCLNLGGMMQVRSALRERELSIRRALGASRARLIRHLLSEALILAGLGGALASLVLFNIPPVVSWLADGGLPAQIREALRLDLYMAAISVGLCLATSLAFGLLPAVRFSRPAIITALEDDAGGGGLRVGRMHRVTAGLQVMIAAPLLVLGCISLDRVRATATADLGFDSDMVSAARLDLDGLTDEDAAFRIRSLLDSLGAASGVASVTVADGLPLDFRGRGTTVSFEGEPNVAPRLVSVHVTRVGEDYLRTMGIPLLLGRGLTVDDQAGAEMVTVISKALADRLSPQSAAEAVGQRLTFGTEETTQRTLTIVGVIGDFPTSQMSTERAQLLVPLAQHFGLRWNDVAVVDDFGGLPNVMLIARSAAGEPPSRLRATLENVVGELDPDFTSSGIVTGVWLRQNSMNDFLTQSAVAGVSGGVILVLAALGIYGVVGLMVATRTREIAVRIALGASRRRVLGMILIGVVKLAMPGVAVGLVITAALVRLNVVDMGIPLSYAESLGYVAGAAIAILVAVLASLGPARRAASVPPMVAMRSE
jgi:predicted permease